MCVGWCVGWGGGAQCVQVYHKDSKRDRGELPGAYARVREGAAGDGKAGEGDGGGGEGDRRAAKGVSEHAVGEAFRLGPPIVKTGVLVNAPHTHTHTHTHTHFTPAVRGAGTGPPDSQ